MPKPLEYDKRDPSGHPTKYYKCGCENYHKQQSKLNVIGSSNTLEGAQIN